MSHSAQAVPAPELVRTSRLSDYWTLSKPGITVMVGLTAAVGYYVASRGSFDALLLGHLFLGTILSSAGASAFNMLMERDLDAKMERTKLRPLAAGRLGVSEAAAFAILLSVAGVGYLVWQVNILTAAISAVTILTYLGLYTPLKTRSSICTLVGAIPGALPPVMGWTAARDAFEAPAAILFLILFFWQLPHFLALAWMYREDYARGGFPMLPVEEPTGASTGRQVVLQTLALLVVSMLPAFFGMAGPAYLAAALLLGAGFLGCGVAFSVLRTRERASRLFFASIIYLPLLLAALALL